MALVGLLFPSEAFIYPYVWNNKLPSDGSSSFCYYSCFSLLCVCGFLLCFVFLLDYGLISQNLGNQSKHTFTSLLIRSFILLYVLLPLLYVRGNPVMASTLGGCSLVGEIPTNYHMSYRSAFGRWKKTNFAWMIGGGLYWGRTQNDCKKLCRLCPEQDSRPNEWMGMRISRYPTAQPCVLVRGPVYLEGAALFYIISHQMIWF